MRSDCRYYESRTYGSGDVVRKCRIDLAPEAPWRCPDPPYLLFRYEAGQWKQIPLMTLRGQKIRPNMTSSPRDAGKDIRSHGNHLDWQLAGHVSDALEPIAYIDFTNLTTQTFGTRCQPPFNTLEVKEGRR